VNLSIRNPKLKYANEDKIHEELCSDSHVIFFWDVNDKLIRLLGNGYGHYFFNIDAALAFAKIFGFEVVTEKKAGKDEEQKMKFSHTLLCL